MIVAVPGATAKHPWWNNGTLCYGQINGWAWGDSLCISEWQCFWSFPNWIETIVFVIPLCFLLTGTPLAAAMRAILLVFVAEHLLLTVGFFQSACIHVRSNIWSRLFVACGAGTILSFQEVTRVAAHIVRGNLHNICRRVDWDDGQNEMAKLDCQLRSIIRFVLFVAISAFWMIPIDNGSRSD